MEGLREGDTVTWNTPQGETRGRIIEIVTERTEIKGQTLVASESDPRYIVESDKTGERAGHTADALTKVS
jgi:hypothetical protein